MECSEGLDAFRFFFNQQRASPRHYTVDPRLLPSGNRFKCHVEVLSLQPIKQYIITTLFDDVLHIVSVLVRCPCMAINVIIQYNSGLLPDIILLTSVTTIGEPV